MKKMLLLVLLISSTTFASGSKIEIQCDVARAIKTGKMKGDEAVSTLSRIKYEIDLATGQSKMLCDGPLEKGVFCGVMRMDLAQPLAHYQLESCEKGDEQTRVTYQFFVPQEDEFDQTIAINLYQSCGKPELADSNVTALIVLQQSGEIAEAGNYPAINCKVK